MRTVGVKYLRLWGDTGIDTFTLTDVRIEDADTLVCVAILVYATYMATNRFRQVGGTTLQIATEAMEQYCRQAVKGHQGSQQVLDNRWATLRKTALSTKTH